MSNLIAELEAQLKELSETQEEALAEGNQGWAEEIELEMMEISMQLERLHEEILM